MRRASLEYISHQEQQDHPKPWPVLGYIGLVVAFGTVASLTMPGKEPASAQQVIHQSELEPFVKISTNPTP